MKFSAILRLGGRRIPKQPQLVSRKSDGGAASPSPDRRSQELPPLVLPHRGGGMLEKPTAAGEPRPGQPTTKGATPADRKSKRKRKRNRRRQPRTPLQ